MREKRAETTGNAARQRVAEAGYLVSGRVQGVGFRWWTAKQAQRLALAGFVRNLPDGRVEVHARGSEPDVARLLQLLSTGPPLARITHVGRIAAGADFPFPFEIE